MGFMDVVEKYRTLKKKQAETYNELERMQAGAYSPGSPLIDGLPHAHSKESRAEKSAIRLCELRQEIINRELELLQIHKALLLWIFEAPESSMRLMLLIHFVDGMPWPDVARELGRDVTWYACKKSCYRYITAREASGDVLNLPIEGQDG